MAASGAYRLPGAPPPGLPAVELFLPLFYLLYGGIQASLILRGLKRLQEGKGCAWPFRKPVDIYAAAAFQSVYMAAVILANLYVYKDFSFSYLHYHGVTSPEFFWLGYAMLANLPWFTLTILWVLGRTLHGMKP